MKKQKLAILFLLTAVLTLYNTSPAKAYVYEEEEKTADLYVDKRISLPRDNDEDELIFRDNLADNSEERYQKDQIVKFEITVKNIGEKTIHKIVVTDKFPEHIDYPHDHDEWNDGNGEYRYEITDLEVGETDVRTIEARVTTDSHVCVTNTVEADPDEGDSDTDTAKFCVGEGEGEVKGVKEMPDTGASPLFAFIALGLAGVGATLNKRK